MSNLFLFFFFFFFFFLISFHGAFSLKTNFEKLRKEKFIWHFSKLSCLLKKLAETVRNLSSKSGCVVPGLLFSFHITSKQLLHHWSRPVCRGPRSWPMAHPKWPVLVAAPTNKTKHIFFFTMIWIYTYLYVNLGLYLVFSTFDDYFPLLDP